MLPLFDDDLFLPGPCSQFTSLEEAGVQFTVSSRTTILRFSAILPHFDKPRMVSKCAQAQEDRVRPDQSNGQRKIHHHLAFELFISFRVTSTKLSSWSFTMLWHKGSQAPK